MGWVLPSKFCAKMTSGLEFWHRMDGWRFFGRMFDFVQCGLIALGEGMAYRLTTHR